MNVRNGEQAGPPARDPASVLNKFLNERADPDSIKARRQDIESFASFCGCSNEVAAERLLGTNEASAASLVQSYRTHLEARGRAVGTIKRRIGAIRALVRMARLLGTITWDLRVAVTSVRDVRRLNPEARKHATRLAEQTHVRARRDFAILSLIQELALNREEASSLDLENYEPNPSAPAIVLTRGGARLRLDVTPKLKSALDAWIEVRGLRSGPLLTAIEGENPIIDRRLTSDEMLPILRPDPTRDLST